MAVTEKAQPQEVKIPLYEKGTSGLKESSGFIHEAYNASLWFPTCIPLYSRLRTSNPEIVMVRRAFSSWASNVRPVVNLPEKASDADKKYRDFLESDFDNMDGGFSDWLDTCINYVPFMGWGWWDVQASVRDPSWKAPSADDSWESEEDDGLNGIRRIAWRDNNTFAGWDLSQPNKRLLGMWQQDYPNPKVKLDYNKSLHVTFGGSNSPEGTTPLEAVWRAERIQYGFSVIHGFGFEHAAGYLSVEKTQAGDISAADRTNVALAAKAILSAQEGNYAIWPYGMTGEVKDIPFAAGESLLNAIKHYSILILSMYTMQWLALNTMTNTGALASQVDSTNAGIYSYNAMLDGLASQYDDQIGKRLWKWNKDKFAGVTKRPKITFSHIENTLDLGALGQFWSAVYDKLPIGEDDYNALRQKTGWMPEETPEDALKELNDKKKASQIARERLNANPPSTEQNPIGQNNNPETPQQEQANAQAQKAIQQALRFYSGQDLSNE